LSALLLIAVFGFSGSAGALTVQDLQAQIKALMTQIAQLQEQLKQQQNQGTGAWCYNFNKNIAIGGAHMGNIGGPGVLSDDLQALIDVLRKENILTSDYASPISYDESMASLVSELQEKYASAILTPSGLKKGTGYVGPSTRAKLNALYGCSSVVTPVACTMDAKQCPNGSYVGRVAPKCEFAKCPEVAECKNLWWYDNSNKTCQQKQFCGAFMYYGLKTFSNEKDCQVALLIKQVEQQQQQPSITITSPNSGEIWKAGETKTITWTGGSGAGSIYLKSDSQEAEDSQPSTGRGTGIVSIITSSVSLSAGYFTWTIPSTLRPANDYHIFIGNSVLYKQSQNFTIAPASTQPSITVTSPNGGEIWKVGEVKTVKYNVSNPSGVTCADIYAVNSTGVKIPLRTGGYTGMDNGEVSFRLGSGFLENVANLLVLGRYKIQVDLQACAGPITHINSDQSDDYFSIVTP
jgi:hypothetical protein